MATAKFKDDSPYVKPSPRPSPTDNFHTKYLEHLELRSNKKSDKIIGVAIFGLGRAGTIHMSNIVTSPQFKLLYVVDDNESKWNKIRSYWRLDNVPILNSKQVDQIYKDPKVDAVVVCSPTHTHEAIVTRALEAKKAVFCEKPIGEDAASTAKCYELAARNGRPLLCAFNRRFDPSYEEVKKRVRAGEVGHVHTIKIVARDSPLPTIDYLRTSGGIFHDCMVHDIDMMTFIVGELPVKISVHASAHIPEIKAINDFDTVAALFTFPSGTLGLVDLSRNAVYGYDQRVEVFGPRGLISVTNERPLESLTTQYGQAGQLSSPIFYSFPSRFRQGYYREMEHFADVVLGECAPSVHPKEILAVSKIATACEQAARSGKPVELKWDPAELPPIN